MIDIRLSGDTQASLDIRLHKAMHCFLDESWRADYVKSPFSRLYFVGDGVGRLGTKDGDVVLRPNRVYLIPAECEFSYSCEYLEKVFFHVSVTTFEGYDLFSELGRVYELPYPLQAWSELCRCVESDGYYDAMYLKSQIISVLVEMKRTYGFPEYARSQYSPLIGDVMRFIRENAAISLKISDIAERFFVSESKVRNAFLKEVGMPIGKYVDDMVFVKAKQLLCEKDLPIGRISESLGFCDQFYFSRRFKEKFAKTPVSFRKNIS